MKLLRWAEWRECRSKVHLGLVLAVALGCTRSKQLEQGEAPPPPAEAARVVCAEGAAAVVPELPAAAAGYCLLGGSDVVRYGGDDGGNLRAACGELFNGECEVYRSYGMVSVTVARYGDERQSGRFVNATLTEFDKTSGAFGFFQKRALGDAHPELATVSPIPLAPGEGRALLGAGVLYVWRGRRVLELAYLSEDETPDELRKTSGAILPSFARLAGQTLGGAATVPFEAEFLEAEPVAPLGVRLVSDHLLEVSGSGPGAEAYVQGQLGKYRVAIALRPDEGGAKDLLRLLRSGMGAPPTNKKQLIFKVRRLRAGHEPEVWALGREGRVVLAVGPDDRHPNDITPEQAEAHLRELMTRARSTRLPPN